jgi:6-phosphogluconolactonase
MSFHPKLPVAYVSNEQGGSITAYRLDEKSGRLHPLVTAATIPKDFTGQNATAEIRVHPSGKWVYCANRGHNSLARFTLDPQTGAPTLADTTPTEPVPRSFDLSPDGRFLFAAGESTGKLATFRIDSETGRLTRAATTPVGPKLWWVLCVP